jgi:hypothetical protein
VTAPASWLTFLHVFAPCFTAPGQLLFEQLVTAWALCPGRRTLTRLWSVIPADSRSRYGAHPCHDECRFSPLRDQNGWRSTPVSSSTHTTTIVSVSCTK